MKKSLWILAVALLASALVSLAVSRVPTLPGAPIISCREVVDAFVSLQPRNVPAGVGSQGGFTLDRGFDVQGYFSVLTHLSMEEGYRLYYVYYLDDFCGEPTLRALGSSAAGHGPSTGRPIRREDQSCMGDAHKDDLESPRWEYL